MEISMKNNIWLWFYKYYKKYDEVPSTICPLFWGGLLGLIFWFLAPFTNLILYIAMIVDNLGYDKDLRSSFIEFKADAGVTGVTMALLNFGIIIVYLMGSIILEFIFGLDFKVEYPTWVYFASIFVIPILATIMVGVVYIIQKLAHSGADAIVYSNNIKVAKEGISNWYNSVCTVITWK